MAPAHIRGTIVRKSNKQGVGGLTVEAWVMDSGVACTVSEALSSEDGSYELPIEDEHRDDPVRIRAHDREGNEIYERGRGLRVGGGGRNIIDVTIDDDRLRFHDLRPVGFDRSAPSIDQRHMVERDIQAAIGRISPEGSREFVNMSRAGLCPGPFWELFEELRIDGFGVIDGDPQAIDRFDDRLRQLRSSGIHVHTPDPGRDAGRGSASAAARATGDSVGEAAASGRPMISRDQAVPIMIATQMLGRPGDLDLVLGGFCDFEDTGWLHRQSLGVLGGGNAGDLRGILGTRGGEWGPDDGPPRDFPPPCPPSVDDHLNCAGQVAQVFTGPVPNYLITGISPAKACAGETIVITGAGFGLREGTVCFDRRGSSAKIEVAAASWTNTSIEVEVPDNASCGLSLRIPWKTSEVCDHFVTIYRRPDIRAEFEGSGVDIRSFTIDGRTDVRCVQPGDTINIRWNVCAANEISVTLVDDDGELLAAAPSPADEGLLTYTVPAGNTTRRFTARIEADGDCDPDYQEIERQVWVHRIPNLSVEGMEVTQAIQYYRSALHLTDPTDRGPDNSMQLMSAKSAWVRVYLRSGQDPSWDGGTLPGVGGSLQVERRSGSNWIVIGTLSPAPPGTAVAQADPGYPAERGDAADTLNFLVPASWMTGRLRFTCLAESSAAPCGGGSASAQEVVDVDLRQTLRISGITVGYNGPNAAGTGNITLAAPTLANLMATAGLTGAMFPVADTIPFRTAGTFTQTQTLTDPLQALGSNCTPNWDTFMTAVRAIVTADGNRANEVYYGIMNPGIPIGPVVGCGGGGLGTGIVGDGPTMAHEVGHALGLAHAPCGNPPNPDPNYPAYEPYDAAGVAGARIGEYGFDNRDGTVRGPRTRDNMSYCNNGWISLYSYQQLLNVGRLNPTAVATARVSGGRSMQNTEPIPLIDLLISRDEVGSISNVAVCRAKSRPADQGPTTEWTAELLGKNDEVLASAPVTELAIDACGCGGVGGGPQRARQLQASLPDVARGAALRIRRADEELWRREAPERAPEVKVRSARLMRNGRLDLRWDVDVSPEANADIWVRWSPAGADDWRAVTVGLSGSGARLDLGHVSGGDVEFEVMVQDGFSCSTAVTEPIRVPDSPLEAAIISPVADASVPAGLAVRAVAGIVKADGFPVTDLGEPRWLIDGKVVGDSMDLWFEDLEPGVHTIRFECAGAVCEQELTVVSGD